MDIIYGGNIVETGRSDLKRVQKRKKKLNFRPQNREKMPDFEASKLPIFCVFGPFLGPNDPFRLFSHHILYPTGPMKE